MGDSQLLDTLKPMLLLVSGNVKTVTYYIIKVVHASTNNKSCQEYMTDPLCAYYKVLRYQPTSQQFLGNILTYSQRHRLTTVVSVKSMVNMLDNTIETWKMLCRFRLTVTDLDQMFQSLLMMFLGGKTTIICKSD